MAFLDLSLVTRTLVRLVDEVVKISPVRPGLPPAPPVTVTVTSLPPDKLQDDNMIGIYLYHLAEEGALKNQPWRGRPETPIRYSPLGLNLHYVVTAHSTVNDQYGPYREQLLLGIALKALHDYPVVDDYTTIGGTPILDGDLLGDDNQLRLSLRHVPAAEAVSYWTAGSQPLRLSAYYEVSVALIEPDEPTVAGGRTLTWGVETFIGGLPHLTASRSTVTFTIPGESSARKVEVQPAQVALGDELALVGTGLGGGVIDVEVRGPGWAAPSTVEPTWGVSAVGGQVYVTIRDQLGGVPTLPGAYTAAVAITKTTTLANGSTKVTTVQSNQTPFQIVPEVVVGAVAPLTGVFAVTGGLFADPRTTDAVPVVVRPSIGGLQLTAGTLGALVPGEFAVVSPTELQLRLPPGAVSGLDLPVRVIIDGSESAPAWVRVP